MCIALGPEQLLKRCSGNRVARKQRYFRQIGLQISRIISLSSRSSQNMRAIFSERSSFQCSQKRTRQYYISKLPRNPKAARITSSVRNDVKRDGSSIKRPGIALLTHKLCPL